FVYFFSLSLMISRAFAGAGADGLEPRAATRLGLKLLGLTFGLAIVTIIVILSRFCRPFGFLIGFSALFGSIAFETMAYLAFSKPDDKQENGED
ncbi:MAG: hypothetical protein JXR89_09355, partial [Deltaproteobacteria bacterium]|nr:hypothetical protein [Deltaproteobacteria bacterium]